jgi:ParB/RepB/Spo0J family partition protein
METLATPTLPLHRIVQGKNPREYFDPVEMADLEAGLCAAGRVVQPILVRPILGFDLFEIVAGERRWRAAKNVFGDDYDMPVVIEALNDEEAEAIAVIENHHRAPMSHSEEAQAAKRQLLRHKGDKEEAAASLGWKPELLERRLALLTCTPAVLSALTRRQIQLGHAELLAGVPPDKQDNVLSGVLAHRVPVGVLKEQLGRFARQLAAAIFDTAPMLGLPAQFCPAGRPLRRIPGRRLLPAPHPLRRTDPASHRGQGPRPARPVSAGPGREVGRWLRLPAACSGWRLGSRRCAVRRLSRLRIIRLRGVGAARQLRRRDPFPMLRRGLQHAEGSGLAQGTARERAAGSRENSQDPG